MKKAKTKTKLKAFDPEAYYKSLHLGKMFQDFAFETNKNGTLKYQTVHQFVKKHTKNDQQYDVLWWLIGPKANVEDGDILKFNLPQYDWITRRENGHWHSSKNAHGLSKAINAKQGSMEKLAATGVVNLENLELLKSLKAQLVKEFGNNILLQDNDSKENEARAKLFMGMLERVMGLEADVQTQFAKVHGVDVNNLSAFLALFGVSMQPQMLGQQATALANPEDTAKQSLTDSFLTMIQKKSVNYGLAPPKEISEHFDQSDGEVLEPEKRKKRVQ